MEKDVKYSVAKSKLVAPKLESLLPADESFFQNLKRSHVEIAVWRCSLKVSFATKLFLAIK